MHWPCPSSRGAVLRAQPHATTPLRAIAHIFSSSCAAIMASLPPRASVGFASRCQSLALGQPLQVEALKIAVALIELVPDPDKQIVESVPPKAQRQTFDCLQRTPPLALKPRQSSLKNTIVGVKITPQRSAKAFSLRRVPSKSVTSRDPHTSSWMMRKCCRT